MPDDPRDALAEELFGDKRNDTAARQIRQLSYEERVIKRVFAESGIAPLQGWWPYIRQSEAVVGVPKLSFQWFNESFSRFPGVLCGKKLPYMHEITMKQLMQPAPNNTLIKRVMKHLQQLNNPRHFVFCFPVVRRIYCAHNLTSQTTDTWHNDRWRAQVAMRADDQWLFVEPLGPMCRDINPMTWFEP